MKLLNLTCRVPNIYVNLFKSCAYKNSLGVLRCLTTVVQGNLNPSSHNQWIRDFSGPPLTPETINRILQRNEVNFRFDEKHPVLKSYFSSQLGSNNPVEDRRAEAECNLTEGVLFGVFDGHSGPACAQVITERMFDYIAAELIPHEKLLDVYKSIESKDIKLLKWINGPDCHRMTSNNLIHDRSLMKYIMENMSVDAEGEPYIPEVLSTAFDRLDEDLATEALLYSNDSTITEEALQAVFSGACACVSLVYGNDLFVANTGDCRAVLGSKLKNRAWQATRMSNEHTAQNENEVMRIKSLHPISESNTVIRHGRLLAELIPLRAFGDVRFKWSSDLQRQVLSTWVGPNILLPKQFHTPPYLEATPEVLHHKLTKESKFLILATDGLWDCFSPEKAVELVGGYLETMHHIGSYQPSSKATLGNINSHLNQRRFSLKPVDTNVATHLIRYALGGSGSTFDYERITEMLSLPENVVRHYRDDITVTVVFFNDIN